MDFSGPQWFSLDLSGPIVKINGFVWLLVLVKLSRVYLYILLDCN